MHHPKQAAHLSVIQFARVFVGEQIDNFGIAEPALNLRMARLKHDFDRYGNVYNGFFTVALFGEN